MNTNEISFKELVEGINAGTYDDVHNPVWLGCIASMDDAEDMTEFFVEEGLVPEGVEVVGIQHITGNVRGEDGRHDIMITLSNDGITNPIVRLKMSPAGLKWPSDFIDNYRDNYKMED